MNGFDNNNHLKVPPEARGRPEAFNRPPPLHSGCLKQ
jgi:hypothetical protein